MGTLVAVARRVATAASLAPIPPDPYRMPPRKTTSNGKSRKVGVEIEFAGGERARATRLRG